MRFDLNVKLMCSGRTEHGYYTSCDKTAVAGFISTAMGSAYNSYFFCGDEHKHPCMTPLAEMIHQIISLYCASPVNVIELRELTTSDAMDGACNG